jgi:L-threonylcarbamoyladenylate synthase
MKTEIISAEEPNSISHALDVLQRGGVVAFPTDTVYGLGALAFDAESVDRLYGIKGREHTKAIAVLIGTAEDLPQIASHPSQAAQRLAEQFWPGPLTLVVPRSEELPDSVSQGPTVGVRIPDHEVALKLLAAAGPMAVTSANLSGQANTRSAADVLAQLEGRIHLLIDGGSTPGDAPSTVVDMTGKAPRVLREGPISENELKAALHD